jgi:hypothetical protein
MVSRRLSPVAKIDGARGLQRMPTLLGFYLNREGVAGRALLQLSGQEDAIGTDDNQLRVDILAASNKWPKGLDLSYAKALKESHPTCRASINHVYLSFDPLKVSLIDYSNGHRTNERGTQEGAHNEVGEIGDLDHFSILMKHF